MNKIVEIIKEFTIYPALHIKQKISNLDAEIDEKINKSLGGMIPNTQDLWVDIYKSDETREFSTKVIIKIRIKVNKQSQEDVIKGLNELEDEIINMYSS